MWKGGSGNSGSSGRTHLRYLSHSTKLLTITLVAREPDAHYSENDISTLFLRLPSQQTTAPSRIALEISCLYPFPALFRSLEMSAPQPKPQQKPELSTSDDLLICKACGTQYDVKVGEGKDDCRICDVCLSTPFLRSFGSIFSFGFNFGSMLYYRKLVYDTCIA